MIPALIDVQEMGVGEANHFSKLKKVEHYYYFFLRLSNL